MLSLLPVQVWDHLSDELRGEGDPSLRSVLGPEDTGVSLVPGDWLILHPT